MTCDGMKPHVTKKLNRAQLEAPGKSAAKVVNTAADDRLHHGRLSSKINGKHCDFVTTPDLVRKQPENSRPRRRQDHSE